jgi:hypothetical protein
MTLAGGSEAGAPGAEAVFGGSPVHSGCMWVLAHDYLVR